MKHSPLWKGEANYLPRSTRGMNTDLLEIREAQSSGRHIPQGRWTVPPSPSGQGKPLLPYSLRANQFKSHSVLLITVCLVTDAVFHSWKLYKNSLNRLPRFTISPYWNNKLLLLLHQSPAPCCSLLGVGGVPCKLKFVRVLQWFGLYG